MGKLKNFFYGFSKSTRITLISCTAFILLTFIILLFFILFPITPSEKLISGLGREGLISVVNQESSSGDSELEGVILTTTAVSQNNPNVTTIVTTLNKNGYTDKIFTTNENYVYTGYAVPTGAYIDDYNQTETTTADIDDYPGYTSTTPPTESNNTPQDSTNEPTEPDTTSSTTESNISDSTDKPIESSTDSPIDIPTDAPIDPPTDAPIDPPVDVQTDQSNGE